MVAVVALGQTVHQTTAFADSGTVQWRKQAGSLSIIAFTIPAPLSAGPIVIGLLVQKRNGLEPVLDASVSLLLRLDGSNAEIHARPTREQAQNKLLYAAPVKFAASGKWQWWRLTGATSRFRR
jgi:hypothetical protein